MYSVTDEQLSIFRCRNVGLIYQSYHLIPTLNVEENISLQANRIITLKDGAIIRDDIIRRS